jgi:fatty acid-binding protein DegV
MPTTTKPTLEHGELTAIIIGTVVAADRGINAGELTRKLNAWGHRVTAAQMSVRLAELARDGRIDRLRRGVYAGV